MRRIVAASLAALLALAFMPGATADELIEELPPFTQEELDENWTDDRSTPSGGVESVSAFGRDDVARIGIDSDDPTVDADKGFFGRTEGIRRFGNYGTAIHVDLYLDPAWQDRAVRAGFWAAGYTDDDERSDGWGILEFTTAEAEVIDGADPDQAEIDQNERWRAWVSGIGWVDLDTELTYGRWASIEIVLHAEEQEYEFFIDGASVLRQEIPVEDFASIKESTHIGEVFLNHYNYGHETLADDAPDGFTLESYDAHWHNGDIQPSQVCGTGEEVVALDGVSVATGTDGASSISVCIEDLGAATASDHGHGNGYVVADGDEDNALTAVNPCLDGYVGLQVHEGEPSIVASGDGSYSFPENGDDPNPAACAPQGDE